MPEVNDQSPAPAPVAAPPQPVKKHGWFARVQDSFQSMMPQWVRENSGRINQIGLMAGTAVILGSVFRGRTISRDIWKAQTEILEKSGLHGAELEKKVAELVDAKIMKKPGLHRQRMMYLPTAVLGLAVGGFIKDKETPEEREAYKKLSTPQYIGMRIKHAFDPAHHSRQTAGLIGIASGVLAIISAFSQPGGALISEAFVGGTLISGFSCLTFLNDPATAKQWLNYCWVTRLPFVLTGTYETLLTKPVYPSPLADQMKQAPAYNAGLAKAMEEGVRIPRWGLAGLAGKRLVTGEKAAAAFTKGFTALHLPYKRMDVSYPIGQWFNMVMATFGFLMAGSDEKIKLQAAAKAVEAPVMTKAPESAVATDPAAPQTTINHAQAAARMLQSDKAAAVA